MSREQERRRRLAAIRAIAPLVPKDRQPVDDINVDKGDDESPPEDLPQVNHASHYSG